MAITDKTLELGKWNLVKRQMETIPTNLHEVCLQVNNYRHDTARNFAVMSDKFNLYRFCIYIIILPKKEITIVITIIIYF